MIETDGRPTVASRRADPLLREALEKGGHLGDEVARVLLERQKEEAEFDAELAELIASTRLANDLKSDDGALD